MNQINGELYLNSPSGFVKSSLLGTDVSDWISTPSLSAITIAGDNLYKCAAGVSSSNSAVQRIPLNATNLTPWTALPQISSYQNTVFGGCNSITSGNGYLFAVGQVFPSNDYNYKFRLVKFKL